jgi:hypothetical protein
MQIRVPRLSRSIYKNPGTHDQPYQDADGHESKFTWPQENVATKRPLCFFSTILKCDNIPEVAH